MSLWRKAKDDIAAEQQKATEEQRVAEQRATLKEQAAQQFVKRAEVYVEQFLEIMKKAKYPGMTDVSNNNRDYIHYYNLGWKISTEDRKFALTVQKIGDWNCSYYGEDNCGFGHEGKNKYHRGPDGDRLYSGVPEEKYDLMIEMLVKLLTKILLSNNLSLPK